jgi:hypothetical protein
VLRGLAAAEAMRRPCMICSISSAASARRLDEEGACWCSGCCRCSCCCCGCCCRVPGAPAAPAGTLHQPPCMHALHASMRSSPCLLTWRRRGFAFLGSSFLVPSSCLPSYLVKVVKHRHKSLPGLLECRPRHGAAMKVGVAQQWVSSKASRRYEGYGGFHWSDWAANELLWQCMAPW